MLPKPGDEYAAGECLLDNNPRDCMFWLLLLAPGMEMGPLAPVLFPPWVRRTARGESRSSFRGGALPRVGLTSENMSGAPLPGVNPGIWGECGI